MMEGQYPINDIVTISDPMCLQRGYALFYKGYLVISNLTANEVHSVSSLVYIHALHSKVMDGAVVQRVYLNEEEEMEESAIGGDKSQKKKTVAVLVKYGSFILAQILYIINKPFGQFDPLYIQKSKYCILVRLLQMLKHCISTSRRKE